MEATQESTNLRKDKENVVYAYNGVPFNLKKEEESETCTTRTNPEDGRYYGDCQGLRDIGMGSSCLMGAEFPFHEMDDVEDGTRATQYKSSSSP